MQCAYEGSPAITRFQLSAEDRAFPRFKQADCGDFRLQHLLTCSGETISLPVDKHVVPALPYLATAPNLRFRREGAFGLTWLGGKDRGRHGPWIPLNFIHGKG